MSAFFVSPAVIDDIVSIASPASEGDDFANELGRVLWSLNELALTQRYGLGEDEAYYSTEIAKYNFVEDKTISEAQKLKSLNCWLYQCSEGTVPNHPRFKKMQALAEVIEEALSKGVKHEQFGKMVPFVAGYSEADWDRQRS